MDSFLELWKKVLEKNEKLFQNIRQETQNIYREGIVFPWRRFPLHQIELNHDQIDQDYQISPPITTYQVEIVYDESPFIENIMRKITEKDMRKKLKSQEYLKSHSTKKNIKI